MGSLESITTKGLLESIVTKLSDSTATSKEANPTAK